MHDEICIQLATAGQEQARCQIQCDYRILDGSDFLRKLQHWLLWVMKRLDAPG